MQLTQNKKWGKSTEVDQRNKSQQVVSPARAAFDEQLHEQQRRRSCTLPSKSNDTESGEHPATSSPAKKSEPKSSQAPTCRALQAFSDFKTTYDERFRIDMSTYNLS